MRRPLVLLAGSLVATLLGLLALDDASAVLLQAAGAAVIGIGLIGVARGAVAVASGQSARAPRPRAHR